MRLMHNRLSPHGCHTVLCTHTECGGSKCNSQLGSMESEVHASHNPWEHCGAVCATMGAHMKPSQVKSSQVKP